MSHLATSRDMARAAVAKPPPTPDPITRRERRALSPDARKERIQTEVNYVSGLRILTERQEQCVQEVRLQMSLMDAAEPGAQDSLYVIGPTGTGKSTAVRRAALNEHNLVLRQFNQSGCPNPVVTEPGWTHDLVPVVWVNVRANAGRKSVSGHILSTLMDGEPRGAAWELENRLPKVLPRHRTRLVVLDDTHNLGTGGAEAERILQTVKNLQTDLGEKKVAFVYLGNPDKDSGEYNLTLHDQLDQRLIPFPIEPFDFDLHAAYDPPENLAWGAYLSKWENALMPVLPDLMEGDVASKLGRRLWNKTHGSPGALVGLLKRHIARVLHDDSPRRLTIVGSALLAEQPPHKYLKPMVNAP